MRCSATTKQPEFRTQKTFTIEQDKKRASVRGCKILLCKQLRTANQSSRHRSLKEPAKQGFIVSAFKFDCMKHSSIFGRDDSAFGVESNLVRNQRCFDRVPRLEYPVQLFQSALLRLWHHEVEHGELDRTPDHEDEVSVPSDLRKRDWPSVVVEQAGSVHAETAERHALCTLFKGQDLDGVESLQRRHADGEDTAEDEDESKHGLRRRLVGVSTLSEDSGCSRHDHPCDSASGHTKQHKRAATDPLDEGGTN